MSPRTFVLTQAVALCVTDAITRVSAKRTARHTAAAAKAAGSRPPPSFRLWS